MTKSNFWRSLSWNVGDDHANRIDWMVRLYCRIFALDYNKLNGRVPQ